MAGCGGADTPRPTQSLPAVAIAPRGAERMVVYATTVSTAPDGALAQATGARIEQEYGHAVLTLVTTSELRRSRPARRSWGCALVTLPEGYSARQIREASFFSIRMPDPVHGGSYGFRPEECRRITATAR